ELGGTWTGAVGPFFNVIRRVFTGIVAAVTVATLTVFMLVFGGRLVHAALQWVEPSRRSHYLTLLKRIHRSVAGYVSGSLLIALIGGIVTA
ncbi:AI-2E family transporter, partial [Klebsiella pneumoniae]|nr:AI-2E family transporter [Klebsiella pneumoniae]